MTRLILLSFACLYALIDCAFAATDGTNKSVPEAFVSTHFIDEDNNLTQTLTAYQSEPVRMAVDIHSPTWFTKAPTIESFAVAGSITVRTEKFATNFTRNINGHSYTVQRWEYSLYPQRSGRFIVPSTRVDVHIADPDTRASTRLQLRSSPLIFTVMPLPVNSGTDDQRALSSPNVHIEQRFTHSERQLHPGDGVQRTVTIRAESTLGMLIPALNWPPVKAVKQQSDNARTHDSNNRGLMTGSRTETRNYTFTTTGTHTLPELEFHWWDSGLKQWQTRRLPGRSFTVINPATGTPEVTGVSQLLDTIRSRYDQLSLRYQTAGIALFMLLVLSAAYRKKLTKHWHNYWRSENGQYWQLRYSIRCASQQTILKRYYAWQSTRKYRITTATLDELLADLYRNRTVKKLSPQQRSRLQRECRKLRQHSVQTSDHHHQLNPIHNRP